MVFVFVRLFFPDVEKYICRRFSFIFICDWSFSLKCSQLWPLESSSYVLRASYPDKHTAVAIEQL